MTLLTAADTGGPVFPWWATILIIVAGAPFMAVRLYRMYRRHDR
ncbi:hypothetical protein ACGFNQ_34700 [Streptomyces asoensis]|nr:hypothetical protein [Streptomyces sp. MBT97]